MKQMHLLAVVALAAVILSACSSEAVPSPENEPEAQRGPGGGDPVAAMRAAIATLQGRSEHSDPRVVVQHILIGFQGSLPGKSIARSRDDAERLAASILAEIQGGADFDGLVKKHTEDSYPGKYPMTAAGRQQMVRGFGDVGWRLAVGEVGVAPHDAQSSPYGWHIIKRIE